MLKKLSNRIGVSQNKVVISHLKVEIQRIRTKNNVLVLYGSPTEGNWKGIGNATVGLFPENALQIPQLYSNSVLNKKETEGICNFIQELNFKKVIISGFADYFFDWIQLLHFSTQIEIIFHGTISEFHESEKRIFIGRLIQLGNSGVIHRFGFVKEGMDVVFNKLYNFDCYHQPLSIPIIPSELSLLNLDKSNIHVGVFGADTFNKNLHNQVIHALMIENVIVHVLDKSIFEYLNVPERIIEHGKNLNKIQFLSILGSMDLNLYMSFNESWGLVYHESLALGVSSLGSLNMDYLNLINSEIDKIK